MGEETIGGTLGELSDSRTLRAIDGDLGEGTLVHHLTELVPAGVLALVESVVPEEDASEDGEDDGINPEFSKVERSL